MEDILMKLIKGERITDEDIANELYEVCDRVHASCDSDCPVYSLNGNHPLQVVGKIASASKAEAKCSNLSGKN